MSDNMQDKNGVLVQGHIKIFDPESKAVYVEKRNAIHYENMSIALAESLSNAGAGFVYEMSFGNGGTSVDPTGIITYLTPNSTGTNASLYNQTYTKVVDEKSVNNTDTARNKTEIRHVSGTNYTDILVSCLLDYGEPSGQQAFDNATDPDNAFVFDELGLRSYSPAGAGRLITHVIFHPVQKSLNRLIQIDYTVRVQSLAG
jgi:hypothetical protein|tara:strand:+ start:437 stop:1039 length:603 start_codon:yes stop_codon:yes gene_type:complete